MGAAELKTAEAEMIREAQRSYQAERNLIEAGKRNEIPKTSDLYKLSPVLDPNDPEKLIRMGSRLTKAVHLSYDTKLPIILPRSHLITRRIVQFYHQIHGHENHETVLNEIRRKYVIPRVRSLLNQVTKGCQSCAVRRAKPVAPEMAALPRERVSFGCRPFANTGIDCFGPITITKAYRKQLRYAIIFTCLTTRAIQVEILESMNGPDCLAALTIFANRWKMPEVIRCDNGTNFVWASKALRARDGTSPEWKFNPPLAPHMGGAWERLIRSVKRTLKSLQMPEKISETELRVFMSHTVDIINSRPLTSVPIHAAEEPAITPNDFLRPHMKDGTPGAEECERLLERRGENQELLGKLWRRWCHEYLPTIAVRSKWRKQTEPLAIDDLVFFAHETGWRRGRVLDIFTDAETQQVREVVISTPHKTYRRPATKVAKIQIFTKNQ